MLHECMNHLTAQAHGSSSAALNGTQVRQHVTDGHELVVGENQKLLTELVGLIWRINNEFTACLQRQDFFLNAE